jgi:hypothetical protein
MVQYRKGTYTNPGSPVAVTLALGFIPSHISVYNFTHWGTDSNTLKAEWFGGMPTAYALLTIRNTTTLSSTLQTTNGFTPITLGADWQSTQYVITGVTKANPGVVTVSSATPTNTLALANGMIVTISGVVGMTQLNTNRYVVAGLSGTTFNLYDLQGNPVDTTGFGTYSSGGIVNEISYPAVAPVISSTTGQITTQGQPAGNQYDIGYQGIIIGTSAVGDASSIMYWEAFKDTPSGW